MADEDFLNDDMEMGDSEEDEDEDDEDLDDEDDEDMDDDQPALPPEPQEEDAALSRRKAIQQIMRDNTISEQEKRMRIQALMSGGRTEIAPPPAPVVPQTDSNAACVHYERNCNIVAPCCGRAFGCRICHDELSPSGHPQMNRFLVREVICKLCNTRQAAGYV
jgi:CHY zinc finger